jgi:hypothetical protein
MKTRKSAKAPPSRRPVPPPPEISAPRPRSTWEPEALRIPVPEMPSRPREIETDLEPAQTSRGVVIIQYGDES